MQPQVTLKDMLYVEYYKSSLVSDSKLLETSDVVALFIQKGFLLQNSTPKRVVANGSKEVGLLYMRRSAECKHKATIRISCLHNIANESAQFVDNVGDKDLLFYVPEQDI